MPSPFLLLLLLLPLIVYGGARKYAADRRLTFAATAFGAVAFPLSEGVLLFGSVVPALNNSVALVGYVLVMIHAAPGHQLAAVLGLATDSVGTRLFLLAALLNAPVWAVVYGVFGFLADRARTRT